VTATNYTLCVASDDAENNYFAPRQWLLQGTNDPTALVPKGFSNYTYILDQGGC
jgi:hypothetical protein